MTLTFTPPVSSLRPTTKKLADATKYTVSTVVALTLLRNRDARTVLYTAGGLLSSCSAKVLKRLIRQPRPTDSKSDPGMPSSHATSLAFLSIAAWRFRCGFDAIPAAIGVLLALAGSLARVRVGYHSPLQVLVGWLLGAFNAVLWLLTVGTVVHPLQALMDACGSVVVMAVLAVAAAALALPDILQTLRKRR